MKMIYNVALLTHKSEQLWFGDEWRWYTTRKTEDVCVHQLWFGDEWRWYTTTPKQHTTHNKLWFGDEWRWYTTMLPSNNRSPSCGLVMNEDDIQPQIHPPIWGCSCGLVMNEDDIQLWRGVHEHGLVVVWCWMKMIYNMGMDYPVSDWVVVWWWMKMIYN